MKNSKSKVIVCFVVAILMIICSFSSYALESKTSFNFGESIVAQEGVIQAYKELTDTFADEMPPNYAGSYFEDGKLVILVAPTQLERLTAKGNRASLDSTMSLLTTTIKNSKAKSTIVFKEVEFSEIELDNKLDEFVEEIRDTFRVTSYWVADKDNKATIAIHPEDYSDAVQYAEENWSNEPVALISEDYEQQAATNLYGGDLIRNNIGTGMSLAFGGMYGNENAIITCGHGNKRPSTGVNFASLHYSTTASSNKIGSIKVVSHDNNGVGDYCIGTITNTNFVKTTKVRKSTSAYNDVNDMISRPANSTVVYNYGASSQTLNTLKVVDNNASVVVTGRTYYTTTDYEDTTYTIKGQVKCSIQSGTIQAGDSGSPVWYVSGNKNIACGILCTSSGTFTAFASVPGFTPYVYLIP